MQRSSRLVKLQIMHISTHTYVFRYSKDISHWYLWVLFLGIYARVLSTWQNSSFLRIVMSVLMIDYGSGIRISMPIAIMSCLFQSSGKGMLIKDGNAIEQLSRVDQLAGSLWYITANHDNNQGMFSHHSCPQRYGHGTCLVWSDQPCCGNTDEWRLHNSGLSQCS